MDFSLQNLFRALLGHWHLVLGLALLTAVLAGIERAPVYESKARLLYKIGSDYLASDPSGRVSGRIELAEVVNSEAQIMTSQDQLLTVARKIGIDQLVDGAPRETDDTVLLDEAVTMLRDGLNVRSVENSAVVQATFEHSDPKAAQSILSTIIDVYRDVRDRVLVDNGFATLSTSYEEAQQRYTEARSELDAFLADNGAQDISAALDAYREQMDSINRQRYETQTRLLENERKAEILVQEVARQPASKSEVTRAAGVGSAQSRLEQLQLEEKLLLTRYTENSRAVRSIRDEIAQLQRVIAQTGDGRSVDSVRTGSNPIRDALQADLTQLRVQIAGDKAGLLAMAEQESQLREEVNSFESLRKLNASLVDDLELARSRFRDIESQYLQRKVEVESAANRQANVRVIESPTLPLRKAGMSRLNRMLLGALVGSLIGWIIAFWLDMLRRPSAYNRRSTDDPFGRSDGLVDDIPVLGEFRQS